MSTNGALQGSKYIIVIAFALIGLVALVRGMILEAAIWLLLGIGIALSITTTTEEWRIRPLWQRIVAIGAIIVALGLFIIQISLDIVK